MPPALALVAIPSTKEKEIQRGWVPVGPTTGKTPSRYWLGVLLVFAAYGYGSMLHSLAVDCSELHSLRDSYATKLNGVRRLQERGHVYQATHPK